MLHVYQSIFMLIQQGHFQKRDNGIISKPTGRQQAVQDMTEEVTAYTGADLGGGCRGCPPRDDLQLSNTTGILPKKKKHVVYWC